MEPIYVQMLGSFSLTAGDVKISDSDNRTRKVWALLAYLLCHRGRIVSQKKLIELLWGEEPASSNPENALRISFHRVRSALNQLWPTAGHDLILRKEGGYLWNPDIPLVIDSETFDSLCTAEYDREEDRLKAYLEALSLYGGDFLEKQSSDPWVIPISTHFHNLYVSTVMATTTMLSARGRHQEAVGLCRRAVAGEPYHEPLHQMLMQELAAQGDPDAAAAVYDELSHRLFDDFGIRPSEQTRKVYRNAVHTLSDKTLPMDLVLEQLQEPEAISGAMRCDYDYFKVLCFAESRAMERNGNATHIVLLSLSGTPDKPLTKRSMHRIMGQLGEQIRTNLRRGDTFSQCSVSQYIIMLPHANYENSCMVCRRILGAFNRKHPHVTAKIHYMVQPLTPSICVP
ncbi:MAG: winged helix-turn-helix domain-containing protein [Oscillospiraceae bacterium]|nr:winged helix-turn-helix domain-containing protein [Oscillospiraceae bacterium]